jgi:DHA2 family multidrug resistance protein-like MFS transporter
MPPEPDGAGVALRLGFTALGFGLFFAPNTRLIISRAPPERSAAAGGLLSTSRLFGQTLAAVVVGMLLAGGMGLGPSPMVLSCALCVVAALCSLQRYRYRQVAG